MQLIRLEHPLSCVEDLPAFAMALGYFDGVHLGHQKVINEAKSAAQKLGLKSAVMTFDPHPSVVLGKSEQKVQYITPLKDKIQLIEDLGVDYLFVVHFTPEFAALLPQEFADQYILGLNVKHVVAGFDFTYGRLGKGTMETLPFHSRGGFDFTVVPKLSSEGEKVSSTLIRSCLKKGEMDRIPSLLGRFYTTRGKVVHGDKRGRTIGFPTANIETDVEYIFPPLGVYAVKIKHRSTWHEGVCNVGYKPTFKDERPEVPSVEVHIFDFVSDIYGDHVTVEWHLHLRQEQKFEGIQQLVSQIEKDKQNALLYFQKNKA
ncbi:bifunctional riboflavin kinase/FAD synthetase [Bacillus sp. T33-2]|nr:bifunctional riboflavin kinase/FAD synthetase [Bacillus sp. T33-2]PLR97234.1 bifunctional riboflavin kinase/FAD synthetase [Bacillus sp. T33-2]